MKIVPIGIQQHIDRVDRQRSLAIGISAVLLAFWSLYRVIWSLYLTMTYNFLFGSLVFQIVLWGVIGAVAVIAATGFLTHYTKTPAVHTNDRGQDPIEGKTL
jgi:membrane protein implicated in regulation of membrane protease activity